MQNCECFCCSTAGPPYPAGTFTSCMPSIPVVPLRPAAPMAALPQSATTEEIVASFNALLASLQAAGMMEAK